MIATSTPLPLQDLCCESDRKPILSPIFGIGEILNIDFTRPRSREDIMEDPRYYELRNQALDFLYNRFAHDEDEKG